MGGLGEDSCPNILHAGFVFIAPLLLLISLRGALQLRGGALLERMGGHGDGSPNES